MSSSGRIQSETTDEQIQELCERLRVGRGRFRLVESLGRGGMGEVWMAEDLHLNGKRVALKFIRPEWRHNTDFIDHLRGELLRTRDLQHEAIIKVHDWHEEKDEPVFMSMEYVQSTSLQNQLKRASGGRLRYSEFLPLFMDVCQALLHAHETAGLIHRDLKPGNILVFLSPAGPRAKVADFGLAAVARSESEGGVAKQNVVGTPPYMSPNQWNGVEPTRKDDIFGLGATMYHALTGNYPFSARGCREEAYLGFGEAGSYPDIPQKVKVIINRCLEPDEVDRPSTVRDILVVLKNTAGLTPTVRPASSHAIPTPTHEDPTAPGRATSKTRDLVWWTLSVLLIACGLYAFYSRPERTGITVEPPPPPPPPLPPPSLRTNTPTVIKSVPEPPATFGALITSIAGQNAERGCKVEWFAVNEEPRAVEQLMAISPATGNLRRILQTHLRTGPCKIRVSWAGKVELESVVQISEDTTNSVFFWIDSRDLSRGEPFVVVSPERLREDTLIEMKQGARPYVAQSNMVLYTGNLTVHVKSPGFSEVTTKLVVTSNLLKSQLIVPIVPSSFPLGDEVFSNRLGQIFYPLKTVLAGMRCWIADSEVSELAYHEFEKTAGVMSWEGRKQYLTNAARVLGPRSVLLQNSKNENPVVGITRTEASQFCDWMNRTEREAGRLLPSQRYSLPSVAQWRSAMREFAPKEIALSNIAGKELLQTGWTWKHGIGGDVTDEYPFLAPAAPVRSLETERRLFHMTGNVREWCRDTYLVSLNNASDVKRYPRTLSASPDGNVFGVSCGGSWYDHDPALLDGSLCLRVPLGERSDVLGFRLVIIEPVAAAADPSLSNP